MSLPDPYMEDLPVPVMVDILSRLPVKTIIHCKCVCKKWLDLVSDSYFANLHLSRSPSGLIVLHISEKEKTDDSHIPGILKLVEFEDELDHHHLHHDSAMSLDLNLTPIFQKSKIRMAGSVDGLICLFQYFPRAESDNTYICNPITREYMIIPNHQYYKEENYLTVSFGFGVGLVTMEYKVIRIIVGDMAGPLEAEVYTLGSGQWRRIGHVPYWIEGYNGLFLNGHAHWPASSEDSDEKICAFDFDEETYKSFPSPPFEDIQESQVRFQSLGVLKGCLCQCDIVGDDGVREYSKLTLWVMKEYGIKKSWHKDFVINRSIHPILDGLFSKPVYIYVIEGLKDGTVLMASYHDKLLACCPQRETVEDTDLFDRCLWGLAYRPSFHKLHNFENERVHVF